MYLGLDMGTSGVRALLVSESGSVVGSAEGSCDVAHPHSGWSEQNPQHWIDATVKAISLLRTEYPAPFGAIRAIGLSGHMHGATLLGSDDLPLRPCMLWNDTRAATEAAELDSVPGFRDITGNIVFPGFTAPKVEWVRRQEPDVFAEIKTVLLPKDYLRLWLTGDINADISDAAGSAWLDVGKREWSNSILEHTHLSPAQMGPLVEGSDAAGTLRPALAAEWGLANSVVVAAGGADNAVAACGVGCVNPGDGFVSLGTSGVLLAATESYRPAPASAVHTFCHAIPNTWYQMGVTLAATDCLNWLASATGSTPPDLASVLPEVISGPAGPLFLPYLSGERTPHNNSAIRGGFLGLDIATDTPTLTQAVMEGVAFAQRDSLEALKSSGTSLDSLLAIGGGTQSPFWVETLATILNTPLDMPERGEFGAALGAARLGMLADGLGSAADILTKPAIATTIEPRAELVDAYADRYATYRAAYPAINGLAI